MKQEVSDQANLTIEVGIITSMDRKGINLDKHPEFLTNIRFSQYNSSITAILITEQINHRTFGGML